MNLLRIIAASCVSILFLPLLSVQAQVPTAKDVSDAMAQWSKDFWASGNEEERLRAIHGMLTVSAHIKPLIGDLKISGVNDPNDEVRWKASIALGLIGPSAREATATLSKLLELDKNDKVRLASAKALGEILFEGRINKVTEMAIPALTHASRHDPRFDVQIAACLSLSMIGPDAHNSAADLLELIQETKKEKLREMASFALTRICSRDTKAITADLVSHLKKGEKNPEVEISLVIALGQIGAQEELVVPFFIHMLKNRPELRVQAIDGLGAFGPRARDAVPALIDALAVVREPVKVNVVYALAAIGPEAKAAIPALRSLANHPQILPSIREAALQALKKIDGNP